MSTLEERVAYLEGRVEEHARNVDGVREALGSLERRMDARFESVEHRIGLLDAKIDGVRAALDAKIDALDARMHRNFVWLVGIQVTTLMAIVGALLAR